MKGGAGGDSLAAISETQVRDALRAMRFAKPLASSPLLHLVIIDDALAAEGLDDNEETRAWLLQRMAAQTILSELARCRGVSEIGTQQRVPAAFTEAMEADYRSGVIERESWSMLALRHVMDDRTSNAELADRLLVTKRTLIRRLGKGYGLLTDALREREFHALRQRSATADSSSTTPPPSTKATSSESAATTGTAASVSPAPMPPSATPSPEAEDSKALEALRAALLESAEGADLPIETLSRVASHPAADAREQRLVRAATWLSPRYQMDTRFVELTLLIDRGEATRSGRWQARPEHYASLALLLDAIPDPALVVLGAPGAGKSTLLRRLELDTCVRNLEAEDGRLTLYAGLSGFASDLGESLPDPRSWLGTLWERRHPRLPSLETLLAEGRMLLLLDGLNEMPHDGSADYRQRVAAWKRFVQESLSGTSNRAVFSCRSLDYSAPLSTPELRVPQVRIEPLDDKGIRAFAEAYGSAGAGRLIASSPHRDLVRTPYLLRLLLASFVDDEEGVASIGPATLLTAFVRRALRREIQRDHPALLPGLALTERDVQRAVKARTWRTPFELPDRGPLIGGLESLAHGMQSEQSADERAAFHVLYDEALDLIDGPMPETVIQAGLALAVLNEDHDTDEVFFFHQLIQEYFAARRLVSLDEVECAAVEWRADAVTPSLGELLSELGPGEPLPPLAGTVWSESFKMAAAMHAKPADFVKALAQYNLVLAANAADVPEVAAQLPDESLDMLRSALVDRSRNRAADLRARIAAGRALGRLGDPRFEGGEGSHGAYRLPPLVEIEGAAYRIGDDALLTWDGDEFGGHSPEHQVQVAAFALGRFAVTNAEWACFMDAGGYEDERWWTGDVARAWWRGEGTDEDSRANNRAWRRSFQEDPSKIDHFLRLGTFDLQTAEHWRRWRTMDDAPFEVELARRWPGGRVTEPRFWKDRRLNRPSDPVVGISWFEARAYCAWLAANSNLPFRLPSEVEWEAAARGLEARPLPYGATYDAFAANTNDAHLFGPSPIGVFPEGDTPEGLSDLSGNTWDWTSSAWGSSNPTQDHGDPDFTYPYDADDGRENPDLPAETARVARGGAWNGLPVGGFAVNRNRLGARMRADDVGFRLALSR